MHAGMSWERLEELGGIQWPCPDESHPGTQFLHARLWSEDPEEQGMKAPFSVVLYEPPVDELDEDYPFRLTTGRRLDSYNTGVQTGGYTSPLRREETLDMSPEDVERLALAEGERVRIVSRRGAVEAPVRLALGLRPGLLFMTLHSPDDVDVNNLTIDAWDPKSGTAEFKATAVQVEKLPAAIAACRDASERSCVDLRLMDAAPIGRRTRRRRRAARVRPERLGGWRGSELDGSPRRARRPGCPRTATPAAPGAARPPGGRRLDQPGGSQLRLSAALGTAGRGLRRRDLLRDVQRGGATPERRARLRRPRLPRRRRPHPL